MVKVDYCYDSVLTEWNGIKDTLDISPVTKLAITKAIEKEIAKPSSYTLTTYTDGKMIEEHIHRICPNPDCGDIIDYYYNGEYRCKTCGQKYIIEDGCK